MSLARCWRLATDGHAGVAGYGLSDDPGFGRYHEALNRARWDTRGMYQDLVRPSKGHFVKTSGLRWLSLMVIVPIPWAVRRWAIAVPDYSGALARWSEANGKRHKTLITWARHAILQTKRWLPDRRLILLGDSGFATLELLAAVRSHACVITRLRLDANLFKPAYGRKLGQRGRTPLQGRTLPKLSVVLNNSKTIWATVVVSQWYGDQQRALRTDTSTAV